MGRKANSPGRKRADKRAKAQHGRDGAAYEGNELSPRGERMTASRAPTNDTKPHRVFVESVPPAMVAEVFEVAGADDDLVLSSVPPPPERTQSRPPRGWSRPPVPHPPHPNRPSARAPVNEDADALELPSDELEEDTPARARTGMPGRGAWLAIGGVALLLAVAFGMRSCNARASSAAPAERPHASR